LLINFNKLAKTNKSSKSGSLCDKLEKSKNCKGNNIGGLLKDLKKGNTTIERLKKERNN